MLFKKMFLTFMLLVSGAAYADLQATNGKDFIVLHKQSCSNQAVLAMVPEKFHSVLHDASATIAGVQWKPCYGLIQDAVVVLFDDGDEVVLPRTEFTEKGV